MAELRVLSAGAVKRGVAQVAKEFERESGSKVTVEFSTAPEIRRRVGAGETADVIVAPPAVMDEIAKQGKIVAESRGFVGRSRMGVVVHAQAPASALGDTAAFKRALLGATAVVHNKASSGSYAAKLLERLGLKEELGSRIVVVETGSAVMEHVAAHAPSAIGLAQISEVMVMIDKGCAVKLAAPLPDEIQNVTSYDAAATRSSQAPDAARALARSLASDTAKKIFAATGIS
ncbi:MAG: molybdate ABC transporter substrate-binding protein [Burkholderiales bacterium]